jgi:hypothetical protein
MIKWYDDSAGWVTSVRGGEYYSYYNKFYDNRDSLVRNLARSDSTLSS